MIRSYSMCDQILSLSLWLENFADHLQRAALAIHFMAIMMALMEACESANDVTYHVSVYLWCVTWFFPQNQPCLLPEILGSVASYMACALQRHFACALAFTARMASTFKFSRRRELGLIMHSHFPPALTLPSLPSLPPSSAPRHHTTPYLSEPSCAQRMAAVFIADARCANGRYNA